MLHFIDEPVLYVNNVAYLKMQEYVKQSDKEIGWLGSVERFGKDYLIKDVYLFDQEVNATTCEITEEGLSQFALELMQHPNGAEIWNTIALWGHSHVNMGVSPSGQDNTQLDFFLKNMEEGFFIRLIQNKRNEVDIKIVDLDKNIIINDIQQKVVMKNDEITRINELNKQIKELEKQITEIKKCPDILVKEVKEDIKAKVKAKVYSYPWNRQTTAPSQRAKQDREYLNKAYNYGYGDWYNDWNDDYGDYWDNKDDDTIIIPHQKSLTDYQRAQEVFDALNMEETFEVMLYIESGYDYKDIMSSEMLNKVKGVEDIFEELVEDYVNQDETLKDAYEKYCKEVAL